MTVNYPKGVRSNRQPPVKVKARHKYHAEKTTVDGHVFDSKAEAKRYGELKLMEMAGLIHDLMVHPRWALHAAIVSAESVIGSYEADFRYYQTDGDRSGWGIVEDVKGMRTLPLARWKQKHLKLEYGIIVQEIR